jgi:hypothetical protein
MLAIVFAAARPSFAALFLLFHVIGDGGRVGQIIVVRSFGERLRFRLVRFVGYRELLAILV